MNLKLVSAATVFLLSSVTFAGPLKDGVFKGQGLDVHEADGSRGHYEATTTIKGSSISNTYLLSDGTTKKWDFEMSNENGHFFNVVNDGRIIGKGYCLEHSSVCHYEIEVGSFRLEETLAQIDGKLYRYGSKVAAGTFT
jgi:hypothetical protein